MDYEQEANEAVEQLGGVDDINVRFWAIAVRAIVKALLAIAAKS